MSSFKFRRNPLLVKSGASNSRGVRKPLVASTQPQMTTASSWTNNRFNPVMDRLDQGAVYEDFVPRDAPGINQMLRRIHHRHPIVGPVIDSYASLPWSEFDITGVEDPEIRRFYEEAFQMFTPEVLTEIAKEFLIIGRFCASLSFNRDKGYFDNYLPFDPDFLDIYPVPYRGFDPIINVRASPAQIQFHMSNDDRVKLYKSLLPPTFVNTFKDMTAGGSKPLQPFSTLFIARRTSPIDHVGTSMLSRVVGLWAIEKALMDSTVLSARRRSAPIVHIQAGIDGGWEASDEELDHYSSLLTQTEEDPTGAVIATRQGITISEIRQPGGVWKISDEWSYLSEAMMRALGVSEAYMSGDSTFSNMETSRQIWVENLLTFRRHLSGQIFHKIAVTLARARGYVKKPKKSDPDVVPDLLRRDYEMQASPYLARASNGDFARRYGGSMSLHDSLSISPDRLILPQVHFRNDMKPVQDQAYLDLLGVLEEKGIPIPKRIWAAAAGFDLDGAIEMMPEDKILSKKIEELTGTADGEDGMDLGDEGDMGDMGDLGDMPEAPKPPDGGDEPPPSVDDLNNLFENDKASRPTEDKAPAPDAKVSPEAPPAPKTPPAGSPAKPAPPAAVKPQRNPMAFVQSIVNEPIWTDGRCMTLPRGEMAAVAERVMTTAAAQDPQEMSALIKQRLHKSTHQQLASYLCYVHGAPLAQTLEASFASNLSRVLVRTVKDPARLMLLLGKLAEATVPAQASAVESNLNSPENRMARVRQMRKMVEREFKGRGRSTIVSGS